MKVLFFFIALTTFTENCYSHDDFVPGSRYSSARALAMGDNFLPVAGDLGASLFYNPAHTAGIKHFTFEPLNLQAGLNAGLMNNFNSGALDLGALQPTLSAATGTRMQNNYGALFSIGLPYFAFGVLYQQSTTANSETAGIRYRSRYQLIPAVSTGISLAKGIVKFGYSGQFVNQAVGDVVSIGPNYSYTSGLSQGLGISHNLGFSMALPFQYLPSVNIVGRNLFSTSYNMGAFYQFSSDSSGAPPIDPFSVDASFSLRPKIGGGSSILWVFQYKDVTNRSRTSPLMRAGIGAELDIKESFFLRAGVGSGYPSAGIGFKTTNAELSAAWYTIEMSPQFRNVPDQRIIVQYQLRIFEPAPKKASKKENVRD